MTALQHPDRDTARNITEAIKSALRVVQIRLDQIHKYVIEAQEMRAHELLGYRDWAAYCEAEFGFLRHYRLTLEQRRDLNVALTAAGLTYQQAGSVTGVSKATVHSDRAQSPETAQHTRVPGPGRVRQVLVRPWAGRHFGRRHPLRDAAASFCTEAGHGNTKISGPCGACWELAVRMDEVTATTLTA